MKKALLFTIVAGVLLSFTVIEYQVKKNTCEAAQYQGYYMFVDCRPVWDFEYLGTISGSSTFAWSEKYETVRDKMLRKAKKDFPAADGLIFTFNGASTKVDAIKFKQ